MKNVYVILGPTSSGKTSLAIDFCKKFGGEIISADSRQIYKGMDIGTGKIPLDNEMEVKKNDKFWEINNVKIWGYDLVTPADFFSSYDFAEFALQKVREITINNVFLVGGTGFYIDMFTGRVKPSLVEPNLKLRAELEELPLEELKDRLKNKNMVEYERIDNNNFVRLIRALEKEVNGMEKKTELNYLKNINIVLIGLTAPREHFYEKVDNWVEKVWKNGLLGEVENLLESPYKKSSKLDGLVYKTVKKYLHKELSEAEALERIKFDLHAYIRRQQTYFKKMKNVIWIDVSQDNFRQKVYNIVSG